MGDGRKNEKRSRTVKFHEERKKNTGKENVSSYEK